VGPLSRRAIDVALQAHKRQKRKYTGDPYFTHCMAVAALVGNTPGATDEMVAAAFLHDTIEDTPLTFDDIANLLSTDVAELVKQVTDVSTPGDGNRAVRKAMDAAHLRQASPQGKTIKLADLIDNTASITKHDPGFALVYMEEKRYLLPFLVEGDAELFKQANKIVGRYFAGEM